MPAVPLDSTASRAISGWRVPSSSARRAEVETLFDGRIHHGDKHRVGFEGKNIAEINRGRQGDAFEAKLIAVAPGKEFAGSENGGNVAKCLRTPEVVEIEDAEHPSGTGLAGTFVAAEVAREAPEGEDEIGREAGKFLVDGDIVDAPVTFFPATQILPASVEEAIMEAALGKFEDFSLGIFAGKRCGGERRVRLSGGKPRQT